LPSFCFLLYTAISYILHIALIVFVIVVGVVVLLNFLWMVPVGWFYSRHIKNQENLQREQALERSRNVPGTSEECSSPIDCASRPDQIVVTTSTGTPLGEPEFGVDTRAGKVGLKSSLLEEEYTIY
jgi:hypothetical protein